MRKLLSLWFKVSRNHAFPTIVGGCAVLFILYWVVVFEKIKENGGFREMNIPVDKDFVPFGVTSMEDFPPDGVYRIPRIIHQTWKTDEIPVRFEKWIKTWTKNHPDWEYWLWTDDSARQLIAERHPQLLPIFNNYPQGIRRADALRYVVLYEFGGIYADLDLESLMAVDSMHRKYSCFVSQEPYEHPILDSNFESLVINAVLGCRAKHPFMKLLMDNLPAFSHMWDVLDSTGPHFVTLHYRKFKSENNWPDVHENGTYLAPAEYFFPTIDPIKHFWMRNQCSKFEKLTAIQQRACMNLKVRGVDQKHLGISFTDHHWIHTYVDFKITLKGPVDIHKIVPHVKIYKTDGSK